MRHSPKEDVEGTRYLEFWNLVFMQFNRDAAGKMHALAKTIDRYRRGLERVVALKLGVDTVFATDILRSLIAQIENVCGKKYNPDDPHLAPAFHVIADHIRSLSFAIADGAQPSNVERGYILRKLLRRAVRYGRMLGMQEPFLAKILPRLIETMGPDYHELVSFANAHRRNPHSRRRGFHPHAEARRQYFKQHHRSGAKERPQSRSPAKMPSSSKTLMDFPSKRSC